ncbi:MAG: glutathione synthase/RimK-type ligase-like ATP-grasp enzyme [Bradymonadia bacterium]
MDSKPGLYSAVDHALARHSLPELVSYRPDAANWRIVVIGDRAVGWTRGVVPSGDFRNRESDADEDYGSEVPEHLASVAIAAARSVRTLAAGVDLLETDEHGVEALEANAPFYFAHLQERGVDIAGAIVDLLLRNAAERTASRS